MDCPKCGTWNPEDKRVCWRCQTELPRPVEKKKKQPLLFLGMPAWSWILIILVVITLFVGPFLSALFLGGR